MTYFTVRNKKKHKHEISMRNVTIWTKGPRSLILKLNHTKRNYFTKTKMINHALNDY